MRLSSINTNNNISFNAINIIDMNPKFSSLRSKLERAIERFSNGSFGVSRIGDGVGGECFRFNDSALNNFVIKRTKSGNSEDYSIEYANLKAIPTEKIGGQEPVARVYDSTKSKYYMVSTLVSGKTASVSNKYSTSHLKSLFDKMFELDKAGIYHGDLNGKNILLNNFGTVNFIDYQWTKKVSEYNFFDSDKVQKMLLPLCVFPENAQMFEMASMPYYIENLTWSWNKEDFLKMYLKAKANYHEKRYLYISQLAKKWYSSQRHLIDRAVREEYAKSRVYRLPDKDVLKVELKKLQFLSDYRDAYTHVDPNMPDRNILGSPSAYLCALSAVQDFRNTVIKMMRNCTDSDTKIYLASMLNYGDYWYNNLCSYADNTFEYIVRAASNNLRYNERRHKFYEDERNPRVFTPNRDILSGVSPEYKTVFDRNFDTQYGIPSKISSMYNDSVRMLSGQLRDTKSYHNIEKINNISSKSNKYYENGKFLDLLNASEVGMLKIREFCSYVSHNLNSYSANRILENLLDSSVTFTRDLFSRMYNGLRSVSAERITVQGYTGMRNFVSKI